MLAVFDNIEDFEASDSVANTGAGSRRDGEGFENLIERMWAALIDNAEDGGASLSYVRHPRGKVYAKLTVDGRSLYLPAAAPEYGPQPEVHPQPRWLETIFEVEEMVENHPGTREAVERYAPEEGPFAGDAYAGIYSGLSTIFDDNIALEDNGKLVEKILLEYKTAKSSGDKRIDGNAHERLTFQIMQYLEVATQFESCSLVVLANSAFVRYRNKYHVNFQIQAERLAIFPWFHMRHHCTKSGIHLFTTSLMQWLFEATPRRNRAATR